MARRQRMSLYMGTGGGGKKAAVNKYYKKCPAHTVNIGNKQITVRRNRITARQFHNETGNKYRKGRKGLRVQRGARFKSFFKKVKNNKYVRKAAGMASRALANNADKLLAMAGSKIKNKHIKNLLANEHVQSGFRKGTGALANRLNNA